ncbi:NLPA lipoprotein [Coriobacterium glomerans PW2]|uniref:Lipoprotein n=1 Tax=Coriobacterium glomerans (strain ATCC 49209 / DSM 20642 / JCM 10262 / PW2) TaxID=700015 RepID=F2N765_CORGP|nr:MetQ/NlpA family ABC transporter substrate-binding protein [Coriobacterium glomerans]AEB06404.1 NLPA lipoprotein [Coriobacterium glomerans PW2]
MRTISNAAVSRRGVVKGTLAAFGLLALGGLSACNRATTRDANSLRVGASAAPHAEILNKFAKPKLKEKGIDLVVKEYTDYIHPNRDTTSGDIDANYFQHVQYLENYNKENKTDLVNAGAIHYEPIAIYAGKSADLAEISDGAKIALPSDPTNEGRALLLLQEQKLIELKDPTNLEATTKDIASNPHKIEFQELEAAAIPRALESVDFAIINGNFALQADLHVKDAIAFESPDSEAVKQYANIIATTSEKKDDKNIGALVKALQSDDFKAYLKDTYGEDVQPAF